MLKKMLALIILVLFIFGCNSNPKSVVIPNQMEKIESDKNFTKAVEKLSEHDSKLFAEYLLVIVADAALNGQPLPKGVTIGQAIEEAAKENKEMGILQNQ